MSNVQYWSNERVTDNSCYHTMKVEPFLEYREHARREDESIQLASPSTRLALGGGVRVVMTFLGKVR